jgi:hypothetical protein
MSLGLLSTTVTLGGRPLASFAPHRLSARARSMLADVRSNLIDMAIECLDYDYATHGREMAKAAADLDAVLGKPLGHEARQGVIRLRDALMNLHARRRTMGRHNLGDSYSILEMRVAVLLLADHDEAS